MAKGFLSAIFFLPASLAYVAVSTLVYSPFTSTMVRYRANYAPKNVQQVSAPQTQTNDTYIAATGPEVKGYFAMISRINKIEGFSGFLKGFVPSVLSGFFILFYSYLINVLLFSARFSKEDEGDLPTSTWSFRIFSLVMEAFLLPVLIIINRAICTPFLLSFTESPKIALKALLSPSERKKPWKLYLCTGILTVAIIKFGVARFLVWLDVSGISAWADERQKDAKEGHEEPTLRFGPQLSTLHLYVASTLLDALLKIPLEVLFIRLSLQRYQEQPTRSEASESENTSPSQLGLRRYSAYAKVIGIRTDTNPYTSLYDCIVKMKQEEGWGVFFRGYWLSVLTSFSWVFFMMVPRLFGSRSGDGAGASDSTAL
ncbi:hypothetical protein VKT23_008400 [Stygiomarasmius scandens]|uniref:Mitochondrial carrier n=1 Tax=Marasmiellus scandens TaxID=2682957 RepID=A0ABR1JKV1_9AGAR